MLKMSIEKVAYAKGGGNLLDLVQAKSKELAVKVPSSIMSTKLNKKIEFAMTFNSVYSTNFIFHIGDTTFIPSKLPKMNIFQKGIKEIHIHKSSYKDDIRYDSRRGVVQILAQNEVQFTRLWNSMMFKMSLDKSREMMYRGSLVKLHKDAMLVNGIVNTEYYDFDNFCYVLPFKVHSGSRYQEDIRQKLLSIIKGL